MCESIAEESIFFFVRYCERNRLTMAFSDSDDDYDLHLSSEFERSDDSEDENSIITSDISESEDSDYEVGEEDETSSDSSTESVASSAFSRPPSPPPDAFRLISDPFSDNFR